MFFKCAWKICHFKSFKFVCHFLLRSGAQPMQISQQCCYHESKAAVYSSTPTKSKYQVVTPNSKTKFSWNSEGESSRVLNQVAEQRLRWAQMQKGGRAKGGVAAGVDDTIISDRADRD